ncbi:MAG: 50S ribosomal protein L17 [Planctomycetota bacterium]
MRHRVHGKRLHRSSAHRLALRRNLARSLFASFGGKGYIVTTHEKAKFVRPFAEKLITLAKEMTLAKYRRGIQILRDESMVKKLFGEIGPAYRDVSGGYLRILRTGDRRLGDKGRLVILSFAAPSGAEAAAGEGGAA